jgi:membrane protein
MTRSASRSQLAYYFFLSLFPAILCVLALASFLPLQNFTDEVVGAASRFAPEPMLASFANKWPGSPRENNGGIATIGLLGALWSSSLRCPWPSFSAMNRAYDIEEATALVEGPSHRDRLLTHRPSRYSIVVSFGLVLAGPQVADWPRRQVRAGGGVHVVVESAAVARRVRAGRTGIGLVYYFAPDAETGLRCGSRLGRMLSHGAVARRVRSRFAFYVA